MAKKSESLSNKDLASVLADELNKLNKDQNVAFFLDSDETPTNVSHWVSTGCATLDVAISNRSYGGIPVGRISEITGLQQCVTEDTIIDVIINDTKLERNKNGIIKQIKISEVKELLASGKKIKVRTKDDEFVPIIDYFEKGILPTFKIELDNGNSIKTSSKHKFFTSQGWMSTDKLKPNITKIHCDDNSYHTVSSVEYIGDFPIVDIKVDSDEHSYFGNGFLNHNSGKSLLSAHLLAETQKLGGVAVMIDTETAVSREFLEAIGVNVSNLLYVSADSVEQIFEYIETIIEKVRIAYKDRLVTIVVDSVAAASTKTELNADFGKDGYATDKAIIISKAMRKITNMIGRQKIALIFTNQLRQKMNAMFGDPWCVDPLTTKIKIRYDSGKIESELTLYDFAKQFLGITDYDVNEAYDISDLGIEVLTLDSDGNEVYKPILNFLVKENVNYYYTDGKINVSENHRFIEGGDIVFAKDHTDFVRVNDTINICDIEVADFHSYLANGRLNHNTTSGGMALAFHASVRLRLKNMGQIKIKDDIIGMKVRCQVIKNRLGPPLRSADFNIYFDRGIDDFSSWLGVMKDNKIVKLNGSWYEYIDENTGEVFKFQSKEFIELLESNTELKNQMYERMCNATILQYKTNSNIDIDDIQITTDID